MTAQDILGNIPWPLYLGIVLMTICLGVAAILLIRILAGDIRPEYAHESDSSDVFEIPLYPHPPVHVTRYGIHEDHIRRGRDREEGCPVCIELKLFLKEK